MQAFAASLDVTFLASPAGIEAFVPLIGRKRAELREFILGKEAAGDVFPIVDRADELDVYAEAAVGGEGEERKAARAGDVEMDGRVAGCWALSWLHLFGPACVGRHMTPQPFAQTKARPIQQHAHVADGEPELVGGLRVAEAVETDEAEDLRLARVQLGERLPQMVAQLTDGRGLVWPRRAERQRDFRE